ncbi:carbohydrate ABC transporter permease [Paenibacillus sp. S150]|uniref:carbohydrate ABC transporter permease n=1 Tax=Paenibacillus sp. S150 TaxID=2749826 RepID=UPI001C5736A9|nr:sugar ABC transporter permease [Paenibacillus sp. S150]MBW4081002.1 sugar ABC transporter permease [Paenibacillus sp. S150]
MKANKRKLYLWAYLFLLPQLILFFIFTVYPIIMSYVYSLYEWSGIGPLDDFVGWDNYRTVIADEAFWNAYKNNLVYLVSQTIIVVPLGLFAAIALNAVWLKGTIVFRTAYFLPVVATASVVGLMMRLIFGNQNAPFNNLLLGLGIIDRSVSWLGGAATAMVVLIGTGIWKIFGMIMIYWLASLQSLPADMYEAAKLDGSGFWTSLRYLTLPLLKPASAVIILLAVINGMHVFDLAKTLTDSGPYFATDLVDLYIYRFSYGNNGIPQMGFASAAGIVFGLTVFIITLLLAGLVRLAETHASSKGV